MNHAHNPTTSAEAPIRIGHRYRPISSPIASRPARASLLGGPSWSAHGSGVEAAEPAIARPPAREHGVARGHTGEGGEPACGGVRGEERGRAPSPGAPAPIASPEPPVALERLGEAQTARDHLLDELAALTAEEERRANPLRGERHALAGRVAHREEPADGGAQEAIGEVRAVIRRGFCADVGEKPIEGGLELGRAGVRPEPDQARTAHRKHPAEAAAYQSLVEPEGEALVGEPRTGLEPERIAATGR